MVMNFDLMSLKYVFVAGQTLSQNRVKHVYIYGVTNKKAVTSTFCITYINVFLPMQLIYRGKTQSYIRELCFS